MSEANLRFERYNAYDVVKLEDGRRRVTRRWILANPVDMYIGVIEKMVFQPFGTPDGVWDDVRANLARPNEVFPECVLIEQSVTPGDYREQNGKFVVTKVYEEIFDDKLYNMQQDEIFMGKDGEKVLFRRYICFTKDLESLLPPPSVDGYEQGKVKTEQHGVYTIVTATYLKDAVDGYYYSERYSKDPDGGVTWNVRYRGESVTPPEAGYIKTDWGYEKDENDFQVKYEKWFLPPKDFIYFRSEGYHGFFPNIVIRYIGNVSLPDLPLYNKEINYNRWGQALIEASYINHDFKTTPKYYGVQTVEMPGLGFATASSGLGLELYPAPQRMVLADAITSYSFNSGMGAVETLDYYNPPNYSMYYEVFRSTDGTVYVNTQDLRGYYGWYSGIVMGKGNFRGVEVEMARYGIIGQTYVKKRVHLELRRRIYLQTNKGTIYELYEVNATV